jgi:hypothetical protein
MNKQVKKCIVGEGKNNREDDMMTIVAEVRTKDFVVGIHYDSKPDNPRNWGSELGTMVCWHGRYNLGDKHNYQSPADFEEEFADTEMIKFPLYLYDHSGITISTTPFSCQWDSGQVGYVYVTYDDIRKEYGELNDENIETAKEVLIGEVELYDTFLRGEVYGYRIEQKVYDADANEMKYEFVDSCWGFYGDLKDNGIIDAITEFDENLGKIVSSEVLK